MPKMVYKAMADRMSSSLATELAASLRLRDLQFIQRIAEQKSLSAAAACFQLTQPAASRWLRDLEQLFRTHLFTRDRMVGMTPTPLGEMVLDRARALLADVHLLATDIEAHRAGHGGHLRLGVIPYVSANLLEKLVTALLLEHEMTVSVLEAATEPLMEGLRMQRLQAVIVRSSAAPPAADLSRQALFTQRACLLVHTQSKVLRRQPKLSDLPDGRWILPPRESPTWQAIAEAFRAAGLAMPRASLETASTKLVHALVAAHPDAIGVLPLEIGVDLESLGSVRVLPFPGQFKMPPITLIAHTRHWHLGHIDALRRTLRTLTAAGHLPH